MRVLIITFMMKIRGRAERLPGVAGGQLGIQHVESFSTRTAKPPGTRVALGLYRHGYLPTQPSYWLLISKIGYKTAIAPASIPSGCTTGGGELCTVICNITYIYFIAIFN